MDYIRQDLEEAFTRNKITPDTLCIIMHNESYTDTLLSINEYFEKNFEELIKDKEFMENFDKLINNLITNSRSDEELYILMSGYFYYENKLIKEYLKPYNKKEKRKDSNYFVVCDLKQHIENYTIYLESRIREGNNTSDLFKIMNFIIFQLKNPDYLFRILEVKPEAANVKSHDDISLFRYVCEYYLNNIKSLSDKDKMYYKRVIMILLESDELKLRDSDLVSILDKSKKLNINGINKDINFLDSVIKRHYPNLSGKGRVVTTDYCFKDFPGKNIDIIPHVNYLMDAHDLTKLFTITIDGNRNKKLTNVLFDDAFSLITDKDGTIHVLVHIPDVDLLINRNSEADSYMRGLSQSVYASGYKRPMIPYNFAKNVSLEKGVIRNAITFDISMDSDANIKDINFYKSLIRVNYNLTKDKADDFIKYGSTDEKLEVLKKMTDLARKLSRKRKETIGNRSSAKLIMDEFNILPDVETAEFFKREGIVFPYKNFKGKLRAGSNDHVRQAIDFMEKNELNDESRNLLNSIFDIYNRVFYDTINYGNASYQGKAAGSVGNPMREYMALETNRLLSDLIIKRLGNDDYWKERIERDCVEYTEASAKIHELYGVGKER